MIIKEEKRNLFTVDNKYYLAHCISADAKMGAGIAIQFVNKYPNLKHLKQSKNHISQCILIDKVFNLITKEKYYEKPTYNSLEESLYNMKVLCNNNNIKYIAMPKIGCGLDQLEWIKVKEIIYKVFIDTDIEILICYL